MSADGHRYRREKNAILSVRKLASQAFSRAAGAPLVRLYSRRAWLAGLAVAAPVVAVRVSDLWHYTGTGESRIVVMSWVEAFVYPVAILAGVWLVSTRARSKSAA